MRIERDDLTRPEVRQLIADHLADMHATSPAESVHALDREKLLADGVTFWTVWDGDTLLGCGALQELGPDCGELKSMRTRPEARGRGVGAHMLRFLLDEARRRGWRTVSLETGTQDFFAPARRLYERHGFVPCPPFAGYTDDPNSAYLRLSLQSPAAQVS